MTIGRTQRIMVLLMLKENHRMTARDVGHNSEDVSQIIPIVAILEQALGDTLVAVVLFGSRARGTAGEGSDWDLLLVARQLPQKLFQRHLQLKQILPPPWRGQVAIVAKTPAEFESNVSDLFLDIALDGVILYDTDDYMAERLAYLRHLIQTQGLRREQRGDELLWRWEEFPGFDWSLEWETTS